MHIAARHGQATNAQNSKILSTKVSIGAATLGSNYKTCLSDLTSLIVSNFIGDFVVQLCCC